MKSTVTSELIEKPELAKRLKVCIRQIELMVNAGTIPVIRMGRAVRFDYADVVNALKSQPST